MVFYTTMGSCPQCDRSLEDFKQEDQGFCPRCNFPLMLVANKYRLVKLIDEGGFAKIYLAHHVFLDDDRERVLKIFKPEVFSQETMLIRFRREVRVTAALSKKNEHIVRIYDDFGLDPQIGYYYVMEYLRGIALKDIMYEREPIDTDLAFSILYQLCKAMGMAHLEGIVHRDLKPENIVLVKRGSQEDFVKVIDFGISKPLKGTLHPNITMGALGTPTYMSPEQCVNDPVDGRSDIYTMGILLHELLTGCIPFDNITRTSKRRRVLQLMNAHIEGTPIGMSVMRPDLSFPLGLDEVVLKALNKSPDDRYQTPEEFWNALAPFAPEQFRYLSLYSQDEMVANGMDPYVTPNTIPPPSAPIPPISVWGSGPDESEALPTIPDLMAHLENEEQREAEEALRAAREARGSSESRANEDSEDNADTDPNRSKSDVMAQSTPSTILPKGKKE